jgi:hypothetical protein
MAALFWDQAAQIEERSLDRRDWDISYLVLLDVW